MKHDITQYETYLATANADEARLRLKLDKLTARAYEPLSNNYDNTGLLNREALVEVFVCATQLRDAQRSVSHASRCLELAKQENEEASR